MNPLQPPDPPLADDAIRLVPVEPRHEAGIDALLEDGGHAHPRSERAAGRLRGFMARPLLGRSGSLVDERDPSLRTDERIGVAG